MIKFFRKIRQSLLSDNKFSKYLLYAIGEIILVVIGILMALQINNWNQSRIDSLKETEYLVGLKSDLENQIENFKGRSQFYSQIISVGESILVDFSQSGNLIQIKDINSKLSKMMYALGYPDIKTTFTELSTTGQINLIKEKWLRSSIIKYYQDSERNGEIVNNNVKDVHYKHIFPFIKSSIVVLPENFNMTYDNVDSQLLSNQFRSTFKDNLNNPLNEYEIVNAINLRIIIAKTNRGTIESGITNAEQLLNKINNALDKKKIND